MSVSFYKIVFVVLLALPVAGWAEPDPSTGLDRPPDVRPIDANGVELISLKAQFSAGTVKIGSGPYALTHTIYSRDNAMASGHFDNFSGDIEYLPRITDIQPRRVRVAVGRMASIFREEGAGWVPDTVSGETLEISGGFDGWHTWTLTDGTVIELDGTRSRLHNLDSITYPDGRHISTVYNPARTAVVQNNGYMLKFQQVDGKNGVIAINRAYEYCVPQVVSCNLTRSWPTATWEMTDSEMIVTGPTGATKKFLHGDGGIVKVKPFHSDTYTREYEYEDYWVWANGIHTIVATDLVYSVDTPGGMWTYWREPQGDWNSYSESLTPQNRLRQVFYENDGDITSITSPAGVTVTYDPVTALVSSSNHPDREYGYDDRGNLTSVTTDRPGGLVDLVETADYPDDCLNRKTCNKPTYVDNARSHRTDLRYHSQSGMISRVERPADHNGLRPATSYDYERRTAWRLNANGNYVPDGLGIWVLDRERTCRNSRLDDSGQYCLGDDDVLTQYEYGPDDGSGPNNLLVRGVVVTADGKSLRTCYSCDEYGNRIQETEPNAGLASCL